VIRPLQPEQRCHTESKSSCTNPWERLHRTWDKAGAQRVPFPPGAIFTLPSYRYPLFFNCCNPNQDASLRRSCRRHTFWHSGTNLSHFRPSQGQFWVSCVPCWPFCRTLWSRCMFCLYIYPFQTFWLSNRPKWPQYGWKYGPNQEKNIFLICPKIWNFHPNHLL